MSGREELLSPEADPVEAAEETTLRARRLDDFVGQPAARAPGDHAHRVRAARQAVDHVLLAGPPGLGKTTLAGIISTEMGARMQPTSGPALERAGDLAAILTNLDDGGVLFIDEVHGLPRAVEEVLYPAMEDFQLDIVIGKGPSARTIRLDLPRFTLVGATTRTGLITGPLRDRFGFVARLDYYEVDDLTTILVRAAQILGVELDPEGASEIASRSRGTPRIANRLLKRVRDYAEVRADGTVTLDTARDALALFEVDEVGSRQGRPADPGHAVQHVRRARWARHACGRRRRSAGDRRRRVRALPAPVRLLERTPRGRARDAGCVPAPRVAPTVGAGRGSEPLLKRGSARGSQHARRGQLRIQDRVARVASRTGRPTRCRPRSSHSSTTR
jgi:Holliday junction DNA helicase RuvB